MALPVRWRRLRGDALCRISQPAGGLRSSAAFRASGWVSRAGLDAVATLDLSEFCRRYRVDEDGHALGVRAASKVHQSQRALELPGATGGLPGGQRCADAIGPTYQARVAGLRHGRGDTISTPG
jgi:hypothetical protein